MVVTGDLHALGPPPWGQVIMLAGQQIGPFVVEKEIGSGAMGAVYRARYTKTGLLVAIKIIAAGLDSHPTALARFEREAAILKKLSHPNIVRLYATGRVSGKPFYAMEFVQGESLDHLLERRRRFPWEEVARLGQQICTALQHAHEQGVVHRDLKPANIMLTTDGIPKLTDFGIAKVVESNQLTATNTAVGTASYMSPEQCRGVKELTGKSDLYSLGVMFYQLLTGRLPFLAETTLDMFLAHTQGTFDRPSRIVLDIPIWLDTLVCQMLEKDPEKRPLNAEMVGQALARIQEKMAAQRSAGADMIGTSVIDRPRTDFRPDETDRQAARHLKAGIKKKRLKRKTRPFYQQSWLQGVAISSLLLATGGIIYWATRPPSPEQLFQRAEKLMGSADPLDHDRAREIIQKFEEHYPDRNDQQALTLRAWGDQLDIQLQDKVLRNRIRRKVAPEGEGESKAREATAQEEAGDLAAARATWQDLEKGKDSKDPGLRVWALLASKRLQELAAATDWEKQLANQVHRARTSGQEVDSENEAARVAAQALHYEMFGDFTTALARWQALKEKFDKDPDQRPLVVLAEKKIRELTPNAGRPPVEAVREKLKEAGRLGASRKEDAVTICNEIINLYDKEPALAKEISEAASLLRKWDKETKAKDASPGGQGAGGL